jgi:hypothetical protein
MFYIQSSYRTKSGRTVIVRHRKRFSTFRKANRFLWNHKLFRGPRVPRSEWRQFKNGRSDSPTVTSQVRHTAQRGKFAKVMTADHSCSDACAKRGHLTEREIRKYVIAKLKWAALRARAL